jgi:glucose-6-phosphate isomerase
MYVEELIGPQTVDTVPPATLAAFREHGEVRRSLDENVELAHRQLKHLADAGISLEKVTQELEVEGVELFAKSYQSLEKTLGDHARMIKAGKGPRQWFSLGTLQPVIDATVAELQKAETPKRLWSKDATLWSRAHEKREEIRDRLGWLNVAEKMLEQAPKLQRVTRDVQEYEHAVLLGMGGSSLCPDVLRHTFGSAKGQPELHVLDTTDPATIAGVRSKIDLKKSLFVVASKSGETTETLSQFTYFWSEVEKADKRRPGRHFAAITDPGTSLERLAKEHDFRWVFGNPADIGGRYSALSYFGMVPGAIIGVDVKEMLERATEMAHSCDAAVPVDKNPGAWLGAVMGKLAGSGRDKLTLLLSPKISTFGYWVEQLLAESTGKEGKGIVPVEGEPLGKPDAYGQDRLFVHIRMDRDADNPEVRALERAGHPVVTLTLRDKLDLGGEFLRWEIATAVAGSVLGIDAFDQPNVQESKDNTKKVLAKFKASGKLPSAETVDLAEAGGRVRELVGQLKPPLYFAVMSYTGRTPTSERTLAKVRTLVRDRRQVATTVGYGPRFLHSTGQLHKGGPREGVFLQIVEDDARDVPIPGQPYGFSTLKHAQALGDFESLRSRKLPVLRVSLGSDGSKAWKALAGAFESALR